MAGTFLFEVFPVGPLACNCILAGDTAAGEAIVIDPGGNVAEILRRLAVHKLVCKQIVITHAYIDHVGAAVALKRATGAPVLLHQDDLALLAHMEEQAAWLGTAAPEVSEPDGHAADGLVVGVASLPATVLHTPGHTAGSICLHFISEGVLAAGDTLFAGSVGRTDLPGGNGRALVRSLHERVLVLPPQTRVIPGHGMATTIAAERRSNPFLA